MLTCYPISLVVAGPFAPDLTAPDLIAPGLITPDLIALASASCPAGLRAYPTGHPPAGHTPANRKPVGRAPVNFWDGPGSPRPAAAPRGRWNPAPPADELPLTPGRRARPVSAGRRPPDTGVAAAALEPYVDEAEQGFYELVQAGAEPVALATRIVRAEADGGTLVTMEEGCLFIRGRLAEDIRSRSMRGTTCVLRAATLLVASNYVAKTIASGQ
jgi:hypothetical protein